MKLLRAVAVVTGSLLLTLPLAGFAPGVGAEEIRPELKARLTEAQQRAYTAWRTARRAFDKRLQAYWNAADEKREVRIRKRREKVAFTEADYVTTHPPKYSGPALPEQIAKIIASLTPPEPEKPMATVADFLAHAKAEYGFVPLASTEQEFKRRYSIEAIDLGLTRDQIVRVYALETGGRGTYDMQSGINPETKKGKPISSALGYAQLLHANSTSELVKHGASFALRLEAMARVPGTPAARAHHLTTKAQIVRRMLAAARSVPNEWKHHVTFAATPKGLGIHALNLDADIGPWLQVIKLRGVRDHAAEAGRTNLTGAELEIMNLAGPRTGLEMMEPIGSRMPTANFFARNGYYRNPIVHDKSGGELLRAIDERMNVNVKRPGSIEFARIFEEVERTRQPTGRTADGSR